MGKKDKEKRPGSDTEAISETQMAEIAQSLRTTIVDVAMGERSIAAQAKRVVVEKPKQQTPKVKVKEKPVIKMPDKF